ncbi:MAG: PEP/pyruvate-binding domain-containing protein, partial [Pseudomonadota bacterium]
MVRSDIGASGVMFTLDTESGFDQVVLINSAYGLGETVVQGAVNPDEFYVYKPALKQGKAAVISRNLGGKAIKMIFGAGQETGRSVLTVKVPPAESQRFSITDAEVEELARYGLIIEQHYGRAMDIEWGKDGLDGKLYILQARPETVQAHEIRGKLRRYRLKQQSQILVSGRAVGQ